MENSREELTLLAELEEQHDDLLRQLDDLDKQIEAVLAEWTAAAGMRRRSRPREPLEGEGLPSLSVELNWRKGAALHRNPRVLKSDGKPSHSKFAKP